MTKHTNIQPHAISVADTSVELRIVDVEYWLNVPRNREQYDESLNFPAHLRTLKPEHLLVAMIESDLGRIEKIDGHRRAFGWKNGLLAQPEQLILKVYKVKDSDFNAESVRLFRSYDSKCALKTNNHNIQGALNFYRINLKTPWLANGSFSSMMNLAAKTFPKAPKDPRERVDFFRSELELFDGIEPKQSRFPIAFGAAALLFLRKYKTAAVPMLRDHNEELNAVRDHRGSNPQFLLDNFLESERKAGTLPGAKNNARQLVYALRYMQAGLQTGKFYKKLPPPQDLTAYVQSIS